MNEEPTSMFEGRPGTLPNAKLLLLLNMFNKNYEYYRQDRERLVRNCRMAWGVDYSQWPKHIVDKLLNVGRQAPTFNVIDRNIVGLAGTLLRNSFDIKYQSLAPSHDFPTQILQNMMISDKNSMNWERSYAELLVYGLIQQGTEIMTVEDVDGSGDYHIGFRSIPPWDIMYDSSWKSIYPRDCNSAFTWTYMTAAEIINTFGNKSEELLAEKTRQEIEGYDLGEFEGAIPKDIDFYADTNARWGNRHRVIEFHEMRTTEEYAEFDIKNNMFLPSGDETSKMMYAHARGLSSEDIMWARRTKREYYKTVFVPSLTRHVLLEDCRHYIQIGRLPLFPWGVRKMNGQWKGVVDDLYDIQMDINKSEMAMTEFLQRCAAGSFIAHPDLVGNDHTRQQHFEQNLSTPGGVLWAAEDADNIASLITPTPRPTIPGELIGNTDRKYGLVDRLGLQTAAAEGRAESGRESGRLFQSKFEAGIIAQTLVNLGLKNHEFDKAEAWYRQAKLTYSGREREFPGSEEHESFKINEMIPLPDGRIGIRNDISILKRQKIIITESPKGLNARSKTKQLFSDLFQATQSDPLTSALAMKYIIKTEELPDEAKQEIINGLDTTIQMHKLERQVAINNLSKQLSPQQQPVMPTEQITPKDGVPIPDQAEIAEGTPEQLNSGGAKEVKEIMKRNQP